MNYYAYKETQSYMKKRRGKNNIYYVNNNELLQEIVNYKDSGIMSETLGRMIMRIAGGLSQKANYSGYTWIDDMRSEAILTVIKYIKNFNPEKSQNAFAYVTQICSNAFVSYITKQKKHSTIKNKLFENQDIIKTTESDVSVYSERAINYNEFINN